MKPPFDVSWEVITPQIAKEMLTHNPPKKNRNLRPKCVRAFAQDMLAGNWSPTGETISFKIGGDLMNGQHRLTGIVQANVSLPFLVCRNVPEKFEGSKAKVMDSIDRGTARSIADVLQLSHGQYSNPFIVTAVCAMIPRIFIFHKTGLVHPRNLNKMTLHQTLAVLELFKPSLKFIIGALPGPVLLRSAPLTAACVIAYGLDPQKIEKFYRQLSDGAGLSPGSPVLLLRNFCLQNGIGPKREANGRMNLALRTFEAIHAYVRNQKTAPSTTGRVGKDGMRYFVDKLGKAQLEIDRIFPTVTEVEVVRVQRSTTPQKKEEPPPRATKPAPASGPAKKSVSFRDW